MTGTCRHKYTRVLDKCYYVSTTKLTRDKGQQKCQEDNARLAEPTSLAQLDALRMWVVGGCYDLGAYIYLGYNRKRDSTITELTTTVDKFNTTIDFYYSNGSLVEFNVWRDWMTSPFDHCMFISHNCSGDLNCDLLYRYICETKLIT